MTTWSVPLSPPKSASAASGSAPCCARPAAPAAWSRSRRRRALRRDPPQDRDRPGAHPGLLHGRRPRRSPRTVAGRAVPGLGTTAAVRLVEDLVRSVTTLRPVPLTPEIVLHTADDMITLWERTGSPEPPFWAFPWAGGQALARHVLDHPELVAGRRVLDIASGSGLVAVAAARAGGLVTANDIDPVAAAAIALNARANDVTIAVTTGDLLDTTPDADVLLAGDVFYDRDMAAPVRDLPARRTPPRNTRAGRRPTAILPPTRLDPGRRLPGAGSPGPGRRRGEDDDHLAPRPLTRPRSPRPRRLPDLPDEPHQVGGEQVGGLHTGVVAAPVELRPVHDRGVVALREAADRLVTTGSLGRCRCRGGG